MILLYCSRTTALQDNLRSPAKRPSGQNEPAANKPTVTTDSLWPVSDFAQGLRLLQLDALRCHLPLLFGVIGQILPMLRLRAMGA
jgi:hypothetical protein